MTVDPRCCGSGTCIVDLAGRCWCGQQWDGDKMCNPKLSVPQDTQRPPEDAAPPQADASAGPARP